MSAEFALASTPTVNWLTGLYRGWEEPLAKEAAGGYEHDDDQPLLGRKIAGRSQRELHDLRLLVEDGDRDGQVPATAGTH